MGIKAKKRLVTITVHTVLILGSLCFLLPFYWMLRSATMDISQVFQVPPKWIPDPIIISNFKEALTILPFGKYFVNTFFVVGLGVLGTVLTASLSAYSFARLRWRGKKLIFALIMSTMMLPYAAKLVPTFLGWQALGFVNTFAPLILPAWFGGTAFDMFLMRQFFLTIPKELDEAAYVDGASYARVFFQIVLPLSKPALITVGLFAFMGFWNDFLGPLVYLNDQRKYTVAIGLAQFQGMLTSEWQLMMAAAAVVLAPVLLVFILGQKYFVEGIATTGLKG